MTVVATNPIIHDINVVVDGDDDGGGGFPFG